MNDGIYANAVLKDGKLLFWWTGNKRREVYDFCKDFMYSGLKMMEEIKNLVFADWEGDEDRYWIQDCWTLKGAKMVRVDGETIKENTFYTMENGELIEVE